MTSVDQSLKGPPSLPGSTLQVAAFVQPSLPPAPIPLTFLFPASSAVFVPRPQSIRLHTFPPPRPLQFPPGTHGEYDAGQLDAFAKLERVYGKEFTVYVPPPAALEAASGSSGRVH